VAADILPVGALTALRKSLAGLEGHFAAGEKRGERKIEERDGRDRRETPSLAK